ncbi:MAG: hypothetical protein IT436_18540, partial [Phycisphaerales bacterium]|nr:hypothetical protein [Phycisphaerales bacterium]
MGILRKSGLGGSGLAVLIAWGLLAGGCAEQTGRRQLERVAKDWCEAVRASQVIPVYPLTEDLRPGDVFMVQTPIQDQTRIYRERGFLTLDDLRHRLPVTSYKSMYFDGYWKDDFGSEPNPRPGREEGSVRIDARAPRAAFPTYGFEARSGLGAALALPVKGVPVGLNFMNADRAEGTITISDARTYAAEAQDLYEQLTAWAEQDQVRTMLAGVVDQVKHPVYLRVVTRVYLTGAVDVSLVNKSVTGAGLKAGAAPEVAVPDAEGTVNENHDRVLARLNEQANAPFIKDVQGNVIPGAAVKFTSASARHVGLSESFDTLLAIGYLGFDVPVFEGGVVGSPIPTFERLEHGLADVAPQRVDTLTPRQAGFQIEMDAFDALAKRDAGQALNVASRTARSLGERSFGETVAAV